MGLAAETTARTDVSLISFKAAKINHHQHSSKCTVVCGGDARDSSRASGDPSETGQVCGETRYVGRDASGVERSRGRGAPPRDVNQKRSRLRRQREFPHAGLLLPGRRCAEDGRAPDRRATRLVHERRRHCQVVERGLREAGAVATQAAQSASAADAARRRRAADAPAALVEAADVPSPVAAARVCRRVAH